MSNLSSLKMDSLDVPSSTSSGAALIPANASPPDFDFNLPCRFFKSSFARSLSLTNAGIVGSNSQCKSLDYDILRSNNSSSSNSNTSNNTNNMTNMTNLHKRDAGAAPPLPQRRLSQAGSLLQQQNEAINSNNNSNNNNKQVLVDILSNNSNDNNVQHSSSSQPPPALPARRPLSLHHNSATMGGHNMSVNEKQQQQHQQQQQQQYAEQNMREDLTQFREHALKHAINHNSNSSILPVTVVNQNTANNTTNTAIINNHNCNNNNNNVSMQSQSQQQQQQFNQKLINHYTASNGSNNNNNKNHSINNNNFRRNNIVWPNKQNVEQECNICDAADNDENLNNEYQNTPTRTSVNDFHQHQQQQQHHHHYQNSHQHQTHLIPTITMTNIPNNQQHHHHHLQHQHQQQQQQQHQMSSYEVVNDNTTNVEAVILQNQVDTLQWQLKQVETSCDMYRAVMEEVARFLERYQSQKHHQQQQLQQQMATAQKLHHSNNNNMEQIPRSKSLYQVYAAGGHEKSTTGGGGGGSNSNNVMNETLSSLATTTTTTSSSSSSTTSYLRARSSTNLIDLKQAAGSICNNSNSHKGHHSKDDHNFETGLTPAHSYSAFKDFTWRRSPKKATDSRLNTHKDDVEEKLNQEAFRLLRTIHNLLNTSQHQPDIAHPRHHHSLAPAASALNMGRLSKAMSTTSVMTLPGAPMLNSTCLTVGSTTSDSSSTASSPCIIVNNTNNHNNNINNINNANNATSASNNLAPEMIFLRSANMRDSRLSLRSSTDSSVHSTSSAASSASSKVETDEEPTTPFHSPPNHLTHKQQQQQQQHHHHLTGSSTEDESGFSSISSFPDIGIALNSTMLNSSTPSSAKVRSGLAKELKSLTTNERVELQTPDSRNSTLKANVVGLPLNSSQDMSHRWDSPSKTYHNASTKFQRFSALANEDSNTVLWV